MQGTGVPGTRYLIGRENRYTVSGILYRLDEGAVVMTEVARGDISSLNEIAKRLNRDDADR